MAATINVYFMTSSSAGTLAETGIKFNRDSSMANATAPIPRPTTATTTAFSYSKPLALFVTVADTGITVSNRRIHRTTAPSTGLSLWMRDDATSYVAPAQPSDAAANDTTPPTGFSAMPTSATQYDSAAITAGAGRNGDMVSVCLGVSALYPDGGAGTNIAAPPIVFTWDEA